MIYAVSASRVKLGVARPALCLASPTSVAPGVSIYMRRNTAYRRGVFCFTRPGALRCDEPRHQTGKLQEICEPQGRAAFPDHDFGIGRDDVCPLPRHRANALAVDAQQEARAVPVVPLADADELPSAERVERVRHAHKTRCCARRACILS